MSDDYQQQTGNEALWHTVFALGHPELLDQHRLHRKLPRNPRCRLCLAPFAGLGGWIMRKRGKGISRRNPNYCSACAGFLEAYPGGADVEMSILFADIRHSTQRAEGVDPALQCRRVSAFLDSATEIITAADGFIVAFYGDCVAAVWPPGFSGGDHAEKALKAARRMTRSSNTVDENGDAIPVGIGVHTGEVFIGTVAAAKAPIRDVSIFGRNVDLAVRLAASAKTAEALVTDATLRASGNASSGLENRSLELTGVSEPVSAFVIS